MSAVRRQRASIRFERRSTVDDGFGNTVGPWAPLCGPFHVRLHPINGREEVLAGKLGGVQPWEVIVRSCGDTRAILTTDRAVNARTGATYDITAIQNSDERGAYLSILMVSGKADG